MNPPDFSHSWKLWHNPELPPSRSSPDRSIGFLSSQATRSYRHLGVKQSIRPLKLGAKNWIQIGHPKAGPRLANLFTLVENCRQEGLDPEAYLIDIIARLPDHPMNRVAALLPRAWKAAQTATPATPQSEPAA